MFIKIVDTDDAFDWTPVNEENGKAYDSSFQLKIVTDDDDKALRKKHTHQVFDKKQRRMVDKLDEASYIIEVLEVAIVGWKGITSATTGAELPCTNDLKGRLPEKWKADILRLCAGKEAGEVVSADQEKKALKTTSLSSPTAPDGSPAV